MGTFPDHLLFTLLFPTHPQFPIPLLPENQLVKAIRNICVALNLILSFHTHLLITCQERYQDKADNDIAFKEPSAPRVGGPMAMELEMK